MAHKLLLFGLVLAAIAGLAFADMGCAARAYSEACSSCSFDASGQMDQSCYAGKRASGTACVSTTYPIMAGKYAAGNCSMLDDCTSELNSCINQYKSGNDRADCQEGSVAVCFASADVCTKQAATKCSDIQNPCGGTSSLILLGVAALVLVGLAKYGR